MEFKIPQLADSNIKPLTKLHGYSLHQLSKWNQHLDGQRLNTLHLQQDLKKQQKLAKQNSLLLNKQVHSIEREAVLLASQLEQQKTKYEHLLVLVKNAEQLIYQEKLDKHQDVLNKKQPDQFEQSKKILFENQKKLQKILEKLNSSEFQISKKIDLIRSLRSERGIHSNVFDKLQKEHFDVQFFYKQLLIERTLLEKQLQKCAAEFNHIYQKSSLAISRMNQGNKHPDGIQSTENCQTHRKEEKKQLTTFRLPELTFRDKEFHLTQRFKSRNDLANGSKIMDQKNLDESKKLDFKKKLKLTLNDLGCQSFNEFFKRNIHKKVLEQDIAFDQSNKISDQIFSTEKEIKKLEDQLHKRKNIQSNHLSSKTLNLQSQISEFQAEAELMKNQIINFTSEFESTVKNLVSNSDHEQNVSLNQYKSTSKSQATEKLTFSENHQLLQQIMAFFNDELFDTYLQGNRTNTQCKTKVFGEKSFARRKHHKLSSIGFEKKVRLMKTQTDNSNQSSYSIRNSECLDSILSMQNSANEKFEKGEKTDNLSIMTQDELIEESKRLIRQIKKKKSQFTSNYVINKKQKLAA